MAGLFSRWSMGRRVPLVLFYNDFFGASLLDQASSQDRRYRMSEDPADLSRADAVIFHMPGLRQRSDFPKKRRGQLWISMTAESDENYPLQRDPEIMGRMDIRMGYHASSHVRFVYIPPGTLDQYQAPPRPKTEKVPVVVFTSNGRPCSQREELMDELGRWIAIDRYGKFRANRELIEDSGRQTKLDTLSRYKFALAFENAMDPDYVSEKLYDCFVSGTVPVYLGAPNVEEYLPGEHCCIRADAYGSMRELAEHLHSLDGNDTEYARYHVWRQQPLKASFLKLYEIGWQDSFRVLFDLLEARGGTWGRTVVPESAQR